MSLVTLGKITSVYGVRGWVKVHSSTEPMESILDYSPWQLKIGGEWKNIVVESGKVHGKGLVAKLAGVDDREVARLYCGAEIAVDESALPQLEEGEYYWSQLEQLLVYTLSGELLGRVDHLMETGANDVLVVRGTAESIDRRERLIPYLPDQVVREIDLEKGCIRVDWDPEF
ncbi:ribosome maturation factor RimM [Marinobacterium nitratireducens]|uniref:Ribosome maturation factor RimM n=1 Tax=Marinobacterium nitratireducens TaxID=518897 RepID=A0A917Z9E2_9GAMM|nr:ribosome maturation factor RimM [Marinobacterium nitratireducens]GGO78579.1 ribosome maturation factor RimM [Marinobacterium nitratireducens]